MSELPVQSLYLHDCEEITNAGLKALADLPIERLTLCSPSSALCKVTGPGLEHVQRMPLQDLRIANCDELHLGLKYLATRPLEVLDVSYYGIAGSFVSDESLEHLKNLPLQRLNFNWCCELTSDGFEHLAELPLKELSLIGHGAAIKKSAHIFRAMPLEKLRTRVAFDDSELNDLSQCPLRDFEFAWNSTMTRKGLSSLARLALEKVRIISGEEMTSGSLDFFKNSPIKKLQITGCKDVMNAELKSLQGSPLEELSLRMPITDLGLSHLKDLPLKKLDLKDCHALTDNGLKHLKGMPLEELYLENADQLTGLGLKHLQGSSLRVLNLANASSLRDAQLEYLADLPIHSLDLSNCRKLTRVGLKQLSSLPLEKYSIWQIDDLAYEELENLDLPGSNFSLIQYDWDTEFAADLDT
ncbi:MAG: hypothetical protein P1V97_04675 [Planctomycetota bacterium]|nr:hypothetical protein [Planctomycetota bacterium]